MSRCDWCGGPGAARHRKCRAQESEVHALTIVARNARVDREAVLRTAREANERWTEAALYVLVWLLGGES